MLNLKKSSIIFSLLFVFSFLIGCATHSPIKQPGLYADMEAQKNKQTTDQIEIMVRPIVSKTDNKAYYDEDLILYGVLPIHVCFKNINQNASCHIKAERAALMDPDGASNPPLTLEEVYKSASKSYARALGWGAAFGLVGAATSAINVAVVNDKIKADYESSMIKSGELVSGAYTEGSLFFKIDNKIESLDGWKLQFDFEDENGPKLVTFGLSGEVEQPRVPQHASESRGVGVHSQDSNEPEVSPETSKDSFSVASVNVAEPWTGKWRVVEGHHTLRGIWAMKQSGTIVKSTKDSYFKFKGKVRGNKLEGKLTGDYNLAHNFVITLSTDGRSFKGVTKGSGAFGSGIIRGKRE